LGLIYPTSGHRIKAPHVSFGYMPQKLVVNPLLPLTVDAFLKLSSGKAKTHVHEMLDVVGSLSLHTQQIHTLSGGEWQRILLARALLNDPSILILDEPTQALDLMGQASFYETLKDVRDYKPCSVIQVSHDIHCVWDASDYVICLNHHICCSGPPEDVKINPILPTLFGPSLKLYTHHHDHQHDDHGFCEHHHD
jgi:zinc transport system ATP-binding protein